MISRGDGFDLDELEREYRLCAAGETLYRDTGYSRFCEVQRRLYAAAPELFRLARLGMRAELQRCATCAIEWACENVRRKKADFGCAGWVKEEEKK